jgi:hypothetical protein
MTRINWDEVNQLNRLDEIIAYSIITLQEAYTAPNNEDLDSVTKNDIREWVRWEIGYDDQGRAYFRYAAALYLVDRNPLGDTDFLELIVAPTKYLVRHKAVAVDPRAEDTSLTIDPTADIPAEVNTLERLLFWAIVLGHWWNLILNYLTSYELDPIPAFTWGVLPDIGFGAVGEDSTIDAQFDAYNGTTENPGLPDFLQGLLDGNTDSGMGDFAQSIDLPSKDMGAYRENLTTCEEQDPKISNYSQQNLEALLPNGQTR